MEDCTHYREISDEGGDKIVKTEEEEDKSVKCDSAIDRIGMFSSFTLDFSSFDDIGSSFNAKKESVDLLPPEVPLPSTLLAALEKQEKEVKADGPSLSDLIVGNLSLAPTGIKKLVNEEGDHVPSAVTSSYFEEPKSEVAVTPSTPNAAAAKAKGGLFGFMQRKKPDQHSQEETIDTFFNRANSSPTPASPTTPTTTTTPHTLKGIMNRSRSKSRTRDNDTDSTKSTESSSGAVKSVASALSTFMSKTKSNQRKDSLNANLATISTSADSPGKSSMSFSTLMRGRSQREDLDSAATDVSTTTLSRSNSATTPVPPARTRSKFVAVTKKEPIVPEALTMEEIDLTLDMLRSPSLKRKITQQKSQNSLSGQTSNGSLKRTPSVSSGPQTLPEAPVIPSLSEVAFDMFRSATVKRPGPKRTSWNEQLKGEPGLGDSGHAWFLSPGVKREDGTTSTLSRTAEE
ncbi:UNVERIFIED_CONTAM: hypothetical protein HDU68_012028 [Siphonaria sp. JEL0065]|nr:hypothetical protein HDU68_012028 [Siphonaria sp. JEL0065]